MTDIHTINECRCGRPTRDAAYACDTCLDNLARALGDITWLATELETTLTRQKGIDYRRVGGGKGGRKDAERPSPGNWSAGDTRTHLHSLLTLWVLYCRDEHVKSSDPTPGLPPDNLVAIARWLMWRVDGLALHDIAPDAIDEITAAVNKCHRIIDNAPDKWYAGPCSETIEGIDCGADLYALSTKGDVRCRDCGALYDVPERRAWLLAAAEDRLADTTDLARSVSWLGAEPLTARRIRVWAHRGRIIPKGHTPDGRPLYRVGDAIDLLSASAS